MLFIRHQLKLYLIKKSLGKVLFVILNLRAHINLVNIVYRESRIHYLCLLGVNARKYLDEYIALNLDTCTRREIIGSHHE